METLNLIRLPKHRTDLDHTAVKSYQSVFKAQIMNTVCFGSGQSVACLESYKIWRLYLSLGYRLVSLCYCVVQASISQQKKLYITPVAHKVHNINPISPRRIQQDRPNSMCKHQTHPRITRPKGMATLEFSAKGDNPLRNNPNLVSLSASSRGGKCFFYRAVY